MMGRESAHSTVNLRCWQHYAAVGARISWPPGEWIGVGQVADLAPTGDISKLFTVFLIVSGVGFILAFLNFLASMTMKRRTGRDFD